MATAWSVANNTSWISDTVGYGCSWNSTEFVWNSELAFWNDVLGSSSDWFSNNDTVFSIANDTSWKTANNTSWQS